MASSSDYVQQAHEDIEDAFRSAAQREFDSAAGSVTRATMSIAKALSVGADIKTVMPLLRAGGNLMSHISLVAAAGVRVDYHVAEAAKFAERGLQEIVGGGLKSNPRRR